MVYYLGFNQTEQKVTHTNGSPEKKKKITMMQIKTRKEKGMEFLFYLLFILAML